MADEQNEWFLNELAKHGERFRKAEEKRAEKLRATFVGINEELSQIRSHLVEEGLGSGASTPLGYQPEKQSETH